MSTLPVPPDQTTTLQAVQRQREAGDQRDAACGRQDGRREAAWSSGQCQLSSLAGRSRRPHCVLRHQGRAGHGDQVGWESEKLGSSIEQIFRVAALEFGPHQVRVNAVNPTVTMTEMGKVNYF